MSANIRIDQGSGAGAGTDGQARTNMWLSVLVELFDVGIGVPASRLWTLDDKPPGSAATMLNPTTSVASFTPDVAGTYKITLARDGSVSGDNVKTLVVRVTRSNAGAVLTNIYPLPAFLEIAEHSEGIAGQGTSGRGYSPLFDSIATTVSAETIRLDGVDVRNRTVITNTDGAQTIAAGTTWIERDVLTQSGAGTIKMITVAAPTTNRAGYRLIAKTRPGRVRQCLINPDGSQISFLTNEGPVYMTWRPDLGAGGRWVADKVYGSKQVYRIEDYAVAGPVGIGNATYDDAAWTAMMSDIETLDPSQLGLLDSQGVIELFGRYRTNTGWVLRSHWGFSDFLITGATAGMATAALLTSSLEYVGPTAVKGYSVPLAFNRTNRTIIRSDGQQWPAGMVNTAIRVTRGPSAANIRLHNLIQSVSTTSTTNDTLTVYPPIENPVATYDTTGVLPTTEAVVNCDFVQWIPILELRGCHNTRVQDLGLKSRDPNALPIGNGMGRASVGLWVSIKPDVRWNETASNNLFRNVSIEGIFNAPGTVGFAIGTSPLLPVVGSQCDTTRLNDVFVNANLDYGVVAQITVSGNVFTSVLPDGVTATPHGLVQDEPVRFWAALQGLLPNTLTFYSTYYVRYLTTTTFEVSATRGGAVFVLGSTGQGVRHVRRPLHTDCIETLQGSNTKVVNVERCKLVAGRRGVNLEKSSDGSTISYAQIDSIDEVAIFVTAAGASITGVQAERVAAAVWTPFSGGPPIDVRSCSFNVTSNDNGWNVFQGYLNLKRVHANNTRSEYSITAVDTVADTISFVGGGESVAPTTNQRVVVRNSGGYHRTPGNVSVDRDYYLGNITVSGGTYTAQLFEVPGVPPSFARNITSAGTGTNYLYSEVGFQSGEIQSGAFGGHAPSVDGCTFWGNNRFPRVVLSNFFPLFETSAAQGIVVNGGGLPRLTARGNISIIGGVPFPMCDINPGEESIWPGFLGVDAVDCVLWKPGKLSCVEMDWRKIATGGGAASRGAFFPRRCGVKAVYAEVVPDDAGAVGFAGAAISAVTLTVGYNGVGNLLTSFDMLAGSFGDLTERRWGFAAAQIGTLLKGADDERRTYWPYDVGTTDIGWETLSAGQLAVVLTVTGNAMSALTQGRVRIYFEFEQLPRFEAL